MNNYSEIVDKVEYISQRLDKISNRLMESEIQIRKLIKGNKSETTEKIDSESELFPLPEGAVLLGKGGTFKVSASEEFFSAWIYGTGFSKKWIFTPILNRSKNTLYYAAPIDSKIALINGLGKYKWLSEKKVNAIRELFPELNWITMDSNGIAYLQNKTPHDPNNDWSKIGSIIINIKSLNNYAPIDKWKDSTIYIGQK